MSIKAKVEVEADYHSQSVSDKIRYVAYGIIATNFTIITTKTDSLINGDNDTRKLIILSLTIAIIGLIFDYTHSLLSYIRYKRISDYPDKENSDKENSDNDTINISDIIDIIKKNNQPKEPIDWLYNLAQFSFYFKQFVIITSSVILIIAIYKTL